LNEKTIVDGLIGYKHWINKEKNQIIG